MKIKKLKMKNDNYQCPNCKEYTLQELTLYNAEDDEAIGTDDYICDNPDCEAEYFLNKFGDLIQSK